LHRVVKTKKTPDGTTSDEAKGVLKKNKRQMPIRKGDPVKIRPEWQDEGDEEFEWVAVDDEEKGRVTISPVNIGMKILPRQTVNVEMLMRGN
jgi:hypothetical protein